MSTRVLSFLVLILLLTSLASAGEKKKTILPDYVLQAHTVAVIINPGSETPLLSPGENRQAQDDVERALTKWGRLRPVMDVGTADLVISVRKGRAVSPTITGGSQDRPVIFQPGEGGARVGVQRGTPPNPTIAQRQDPRPGLSSEAGSAEDSFEVYRGGVEYPLDNSPVWRYMGKNALHPPTVPAVMQFRKVIEEAEKQQKEKQKKKP